MSISLPPELLYDIIAIVVADYIDFAITLPPAEEKQRIEEFIATQHHNAFPDPLDDAKQTTDLGANVLRRAQEDAKYAVEKGEDDEGWYCEILDDSSDYYYNSDTEDDEKEEMRQGWDVQEAKDRLPANPVIPFLSVSKHFREVALKVLSDALGTKEDENGRSAIAWSNIYQFRRLYRIAHTWKHPIFDLFFDIMEKIKRLALPALLRAYAYICAITYTQSRLLTDFFFHDKEDSVSLSQTIMTAVRTISQPLRTRVSNHICYRHEAFHIIQTLKEKIIDLRESYNVISDLCYDSDKDIADCATEIGEVQRKLLDFHVAQKTLKKLDPSIWIYTLEIPSVFQDIIGLSYEDSRWRDHIDIITLRLIAKPLFLKWVRESRVSPYIMFPP